MELSAWFEDLLFGDGVAGNPAVVTVIGSGGKTSLIWRLASSDHSRVAGRKILVTPTTKMLVPPPEEKLYDRYYDGITEGITKNPIPGITLAGCFNEKTGKLESLPLPALSAIITNRRFDGYDLVLIEGDGSRGLPLKAWAADEPVVPAFTTLTVGVLPLCPLGKPISESLIHRLPLFLSITGAAAGETLKPEHITAVITGGAGGDSLFAKARGKKLLFFNQIEDDGALKQAREIAGLLPLDFRAGLCAIIAGSVQRNEVISMK